MSHQHWGDSAASLVIDASVVINLAATGCGADILTCLRRPVFVAEAVIAELTLGAEVGRPHAAVLDQWLKHKKVKRKQLSDLAGERFEELVSGSSLNTLDDGEAATIAHALEDEAIAVLDERKATRICAEHFPDLQCISTTDLLLHSNVVDALGKSATADAVYNALVHARMRVPADYHAAVAGLIGSERLKKCFSLPLSVRSLG